MIWVAVVIFFLTASAALAIDLSGAFGAAQTDQNVADLACLAGVKELPSGTDAINTAVAYIDSNWPEMSGGALTITGSTADYIGTGGNSVYIDADYRGSGDSMYLRTTEVTDNHFGKTIGQNTTTVRQEAACSGQSVKNGVGLLPIGALAGPWGGDLFDCAAKLTGNCGAVAPDSPGANAYRDAVANGIPGDFVKHWGNENLPDPDTQIATVDCYALPCNVTETEPGNMVGPWHAGLEMRFTNSGIFCNQDGWFNCDTVGQVFGADLQDLSELSTAPPGWNDSLYGSFAAAQGNVNTNHYYYNGSTMQCLSARIATIPIINKDLDWELDDSAGTWPNGRKDMKMIGFYTIYIREPDTISDIGGPMDADIVWFGSQAKCADTNEAFKPLGSNVQVETGVKLVAP